SERPVQGRAVDHKRGDEDDGENQRRRRRVSDDRAGAGPLNRQGERPDAPVTKRALHPITQLLASGQRCDANTLVLPVLSKASTSYGAIVPLGTSIPGEPAGIPATANPTTFGRSLSNRVMSS